MFSFFDEISFELNKFYSGDSTPIFYGFFVKNQRVKKKREKIRNRASLSFFRISDIAECLFERI